MLDEIVTTYDRFGLCIHGLIPGAYLHTEDTTTTYHQEGEENSPAAEEEGGEVGGDVGGR